MPHTVILRHDGTDRHYHCENYPDAMVLFDTLCKAYPSIDVELWFGSVLKAKQNP